MTCPNCDPFNTELLIESPGQLVRIGEKLRTAVNEGTLIYNSFESDREIMGQSSFMTLVFASPLPDVMRYHFNCPICGNCYGLFAETYHGRGGKWTLLGNLAANIKVESNTE